MFNLVFLCYKAGIKVGENYGCKIMYGVMKSKGIETKIGKVFDEINLEAQRKSHNTASCSFNPKVYNAIYFAHKIYYDQNEKLGMFGVVHVCTLDGFSGKIVGQVTMI